MNGTNWFNNAQLIGERNYRDNMPTNTSYPRNISSGDGWQVRFYMESDDAAKLYVNGSDILNTNYNTR